MICSLVTDLGSVRLRRLSWNKYNQIPLTQLAVSENYAFDLTAHRHLLRFKKIVNQDKTVDRIEGLSTVMSHVPQRAKKKISCFMKLRSIGVRHRVCNGKDMNHTNPDLRRCAMKLFRVTTVVGILVMTAFIMPQHSWAWTRVGVGITVGVPAPVVAYPAPVYYPPAYYAAPPVYGPPVVAWPRYGYYRPWHPGHHYRSYGPYYR